MARRDEGRLQDPHSFAVPEQARVAHVELDLRADFRERRLDGTATLDLALATGATEVVLDTRDLDIRGVTDGSGRALDWSLGEGRASNPVLGHPLVVRLPAGVERVVVSYATRPEAAALQWLSPAQTAGKERPYLFSQGQSILTRTWVPTQDSPGIRQTYAARIVVPESLTAVMSAEMLTPAGEVAPGGRAFRFRMDEPIPPYLFALAVGDLERREVGPRTAVWAEPAVVDAAAWEFADMERMLETAERLYGPYRWGRYDVLVLPPSFPFGGMENPRLTFATPTVLAGDRSLVALVAHELAHSWSGNLVTNATWNDFWLNEGFTVYFEHRIMEALYGRERAGMLANLGWQELHETVRELGGPTSPDTRLRLDLAGRDPDEGMTRIAYEKGVAFLRAIEAVVGRERWDAYLRSYFDRHAFRSMTTEAFLADLRANLFGGDTEPGEALQLDRWVYEPGVPESAAEPHPDAFAAVDGDARAFAAGAPAAELHTEGWSTQEWQHFLGALPEEIPEPRLAELDRAFHLSQRGNAEILFSWLQLAVRNRYQAAVPALERFLTGQGRRKFLKPLYEELMRQGEWGRSLAGRIYASARAMYHPVSTHTIDTIVK